MLLVEDNPTDAFVIQDVLREYGLDLHLRIAGDGDDALRYLQELERDPSSPCPALILLDLNLPKVPGLDVLKKLRSASRCRNIPVVVVSSSIAEADKWNSRELGVEAYFQKPVDLAAYEKLAEIVKSLLRPDA